MASLTRRAFMAMLGALPFLGKRAEDSSDEPVIWKRGHIECVTYEAGLPQGSIRGAFKTTNQATGEVFGDRMYVHLKRIENAYNRPPMYRPLAHIASVEKEVLTRA